jgi:hypothetical protein
VFCPQRGTWAGEIAPHARGESHQRTFPLRLLRSGVRPGASRRSRLMQQIRLVATGNRTFVAGVDPPGFACGVNINSG